MEIRSARLDDAAAIAAIYNHYVLNTTISFEEAAVRDADMEERIGNVLDAGLPWIVAVRNGEVLGYAYATKWRVRHAYRFSVETSVYVSSGLPRAGIGSALYRELIARLRAAGVHVAIGGIAQPNPASVALHENMGYVQVAVFSEVGYKFDRWIDVGYWQLTFSEPPGTGAPRQESIA